MKPRPKPTPQKSKTDWSNVADWYNNLVGVEGSEYQREVVHPGVLKLLGDVAGRKILDVACGQGVLCRLLQSKRASVTGVDAARELIEAARKHASNETSENRIDYLVGDARELLSIKTIAGKTFDAMTCILAIQNFHPIAPLFHAAAQLLNPGGRFVIVMMHPAFRGAKESHWGWDDDAAVQFRRVDRYLVPRKAPIYANPGKKDGNYTWTFHKPIEAFVGAAVKAGLLIDGLEEWPSHKQSQPGPRAAAENTARKEIPMFLALRCVKQHMQMATT